MKISKTRHIYGYVADLVLKKYFRFVFEDKIPTFAILFLSNKECQGRLKMKRFSL